MGVASSHDLVRVSLRSSGYHVILDEILLFMFSLLRESKPCLLLISAFSRPKNYIMPLSIFILQESFLDVLHSTAPFTEYRSQYYRFLFVSILN